MSYRVSHHEQTAPVGEATLYALRPSRELWAQIDVMILAAGRGRRMGQPKALLPWKGRSFLAHLLSLYLEAGSLRCFVVTETDVRDALLSELTSTQTERVVWVEGAADEMPLQSIHRGLAERDAQQTLGPAAQEARALCVGPVDQGPFPLRMLTELSRDFVPGSDKVHIPTFQGKQGHPVLIGASFLPRLLTDHMEGLRGHLQAQQGALVPVEVSTVATLRNLNLPSQYQAFLRHPRPQEEVF